jgi:hypothetical protein
MSREEEKDDKIKYCPKRISSPISILIPISKCELILSTSSANPLRRTTKIINNLKRQSDQTDRPEPDSKRFKLNQDKALVAQHCNSSFHSFILYLLTHNHVNRFIQIILDQILIVKLETILQLLDSRILIIGLNQFYLLNSLEGMV